MAENKVIRGDDRFGEKPQKPVMGVSRNGWNQGDPR
jgi:hypothetical protein